MIHANGGRATPQGEAHDYPEEGVLMRRRENIALLYVPEPTPEPESAPQAA